MSPLSSALWYVCTCVYISRCVRVFVHTSVCVCEYVVIYIHMVSFFGLCLLQCLQICLHCRQHPGMYVYVIIFTGVRMWIFISLYTDGVIFETSFATVVTKENRLLLVRWYVCIYVRKYAYGQMYIFLNITYLRIYVHIHIDMFQTYPIKIHVYIFIGHRYFAIFIRTCVCMYVCLWTYKRVCVCLWTYICVCVCVCMCVQMSTCSVIHINMYTNTRTCVYMYIHMCTCINIYTYIHMYIYVQIYIFMFVVSNSVLYHVVTDIYIYACVYTSIYVYISTRTDHMVTLLRGKQCTTSYCYKEGVIIDVESFWKTVNIHAYTYMSTQHGNIIEGWTV